MPHLPCPMWDVSPRIINQPIWSQVGLLRVLHAGMLGSGTVCQGVSLPSPPCIWTRWESWGNHKLLLLYAASCGSHESYSIWEAAKHVHWDLKNKSRRNSKMSQWSSHIVPSSLQLRGVVSTLLPLLWSFDPCVWTSFHLAVIFMTNKI